MMDELTDILAGQLAREIDNNILKDLINSVSPIYRMLPKDYGILEKFNIGDIIETHHESFVEGYLLLFLSKEEGIYHFLYNGSIIKFNKKLGTEVAGLDFKIVARRENGLDKM